MTDLDTTFKGLVHDSRKYLSDRIKRYNKARTEKEKKLKIEYVYRHYCRTAARLCCLLNDDNEEEK